MKIEKKSKYGNDRYTQGWQYRSEPELGWPPPYFKKLLGSIKRQISLITDSRCCKCCCAGRSRISPKLQFYPNNGVNNSQAYDVWPFLGEHLIKGGVLGLLIFDRNWRVRRNRPEDFEDFLQVLPEQ